MGKADIKLLIGPSVNYEDIIVNHTIMIPKLTNTTINNNYGGVLLRWQLGYTEQTSLFDIL